MTVKMRNNMSAVRRQIMGKSTQFLTAASTIGASWSKQWAPIAYSTLVNSQNIKVETHGTLATATVGFYTGYAKYLEQNEGWRPKPTPKYGSKGKGSANAWNPNARPGFLRLGFEAPQPQSEIAKARQIFKAPQ